MSNRVELYKFATNYELRINGLPCKEDFTGDNLTEIKEEVNTFLTSEEGISRLSGTFPDPTDQFIEYINEADDINFDGTNNSKIFFIDKTK
jgi:hypothetical protein